MRLIPGKTKVQIELFKGVTLSDILIALAAAVMVVFVITSSLPGKLYIILGLVLITAILLVRLDAEPNYIYLLHILRYFGYRHRYRRTVSDRSLVKRPENEETAVEEETSAETAAERRARRKAERAERRADDKILKNRKTTKEEQDAIWLKRAQQSAARKQEKKAKKAEQTYDMSEIIGFTGIKDDLIEYAGEYFGAAIEIPTVEFRFFSEHRRTNSIENAVGRVLRALPGDYAANIVKIERPTIYDEYLANEYKKVDALRASYEGGVITEEELKSRVEVLCDRINDLRNLCYDQKVVQPFYYIVLYDSDRLQLNNMVNNALDTLRSGEINAHRLNSKELAVFLKYSNRLDFDERDVEAVAPEDYAKWAMPESLVLQHRTATVDGIVTHNLRMINYPTQVGDAWLASVMSIPATKVVVKCKPMDRTKAVRSIDRSLQELRGQYAATGIDSRRIELQEHIDTLSSLLSMLQGDNETLLEVNVYVTAYDIVNTRIARGDKDGSIRSSLANINNMKRVVRRIYQENGMRLGTMEFDQVEAFIGSQINAWDPLGKKGRGIPSNSVAACYPWIYAHISDVKGVKLGTSDGVPVFIDFFRRDSERVNSNMVIVGKSGSGKSYATKSLLTNLAADDAKIFILDPENEYTELAANLHGKFINVGNAQYGRLNPFHIITALDDDESDGSSISGSYATHLQFLEEFFRQILPDCDKDAMEYLNSLIDRMYTNLGITGETDLSRLGPEDYPTFDDLYDAILSEFQSTDNEYIRTMLRTLMNYIAKFSSGGRNANIWNGPSTVTTDENFTVFNFQSLLANRNGSIANAQMLLVLKYIDNEIIKNRDYNTKYRLNRKIVVVIDEAHVFIDTKYPVALDFMFQLAKRIRKYNGMQIVITQNIKDFVGSEEIARKSTAIINACQYSFIFALAPNDMDDLCKLYEKAGGINENEQEQIVSAPRGQAFTVMSPQSRSSFKIEVPEGIVEMFQENEYGGHYFNGEDGARKWEEFIGDSRDAHKEHRSAESSAVSAQYEREVSRKRVTFVEMTEEEYAAEKAAKAMAEAEMADEADGETEIFAEEDSANAGNSTDGTEKTVLLTPEEHSDASEEEDYPDIPELPEDPEEFAKLPKKSKRAAVSAPVQRESAQNHETERLLSELLGKFSYETMMQEIRRSVREELEKERAEQSAATAVAVNPAADEAAAEVAAVEETAQTAAGTEAAAEVSEDAGVAGNAETAADAGAADAAQEVDTPFDIMQVLMLEAQNMSDMSPIDMMEEYGETVLEVSLEELMQYNTKHR